MSQYADMQRVESIGSIEADGDGVGSDDLNKLKKMIQKVEGNLIRRIAMVEGGLSKISNLEEDMAIVKVDVLRALKPK